MNIKQQVKAQGVKWWGKPGDEGDGGVTWVLLKSMPSISDAEILESLEMFRYYGGPGQPFTHTPTVTRSKTRVLVTQCFGLDI